MLNDIKLHGRLGKDPDLKVLQGQKGPYSRVTFTLAVGRDYGDETDWFLCAMSGKRAEVLDKYFRKGQEIVVWGRMESYKPKNDPDHTAWIVKMTGFDFAGSSSSGTSNGSGSTGSFRPVTGEPRLNEPTQASFDDMPDSFEEAEDDIPF